ncbi:TonB-dependent receptor [Maribacter sp.]|uniref:TonB-dependent receptor domain-containing protein n=1 Tax=Maribacter sp. TaxID=1897614 RepID=UPI0025BB5045|nr:TonB-dependent receptor [Maribacter sp.]
MKKNSTTKMNSSWTLKFDLKMKLSLLFLFTTVFALQANRSYSQVTKMSLDMHNVTVEKVLSEIETNTEFKFLYNTKAVDLNRKLSIKVKNARIENILKKIFTNAGTKYEIDNRKILLYKVEFKNVTNKINNTKENTKLQLEVRGKVTDEKGEPLPGASVVEKGTTNGTTVDFDGNFVIEVTDTSATLIFSYIGYVKEEVVIGENITLNIQLNLDLLSLDEVVVTGSGNPKTKLESSVAITTMGSKQIEEQAPQSTADLLQSIPGFLVETSAGETGNNLFARGIPTAGAYEYVQFQEDGLPVFEDGALQFANIDQFQRTDATVKRLEAIKGGTASIYASGAPGGIINFISKTGQNEFQGTTKLTVGDYGYYRTDFNFGGALVQDKLFFNVGGFYRVDEGVRTTGFDANKGGQFKINMTYKFDKGYARINYKKLNDRTTFYQSTPFIWDNGEIKEYPGFNANYGTFTGRYAKLNIPQAGGGFFEANIEDGAHPIVDAIGGEFKYALSDNIIVKNSFRSTTIDHSFNAIFAAQWMGDVSTQTDLAANNGWDNAIYTLEAPGNPSLDGGSELKRADYWYIHKDMDNFVNNLSFNFNWDKVNLNIGHYYSNWRSHQFWNWSSFLVTASDNPKLVNATNSVTGEEYTYNGISGISWLQRESEVKGVVRAVFADAEIKANDNLTFNLGLRYDDDKYSGFGDNGSFGNDIGILPNNRADDGVNILNGDYIHWDYYVSELSYSLAGSYKFNDNLASYLRYSRGFRAPIEESFYNAVGSGQGSVALESLKNTELKQTELGLKYSGEKIAVFANLFHMNLENVAYQDIGTGGVAEGKFANLQNIGLELETILNLGDFGLTFNGTLQKPEYKGFEGSAEEDNGNTARRISKFYFNIRPDFNITNHFNLYAKYSYFGDKYQDIGNTFELPGFGVFNAGASYTLNNLRFGLDATNLTNTIGLTEADGRQNGAVPTNGQTFMARSIFGRTIKLSISVNF